MPAARIVEPTRPRVEHAVPDGEIKTGMLFHLEQLVERAEHLRGRGHVGRRQRALAQLVHYRCAVHGRARAMAGDVDQIADEQMLGQLAIAEGIAAEPRRWLVDPV